MEMKMTKQGVITAVLDCTQKLGHVPSHIELMKNTTVSRKQIRWHFGTYAGLLRECELEGSGSGYRVEMDDLFRDWAGTARALKKLPTITEYELASQYSVRPLITRFGSWKLAPHGLKQYAEQKGWTEEWKDVLAWVPTPGLDDAAGATKAVTAQGPDHPQEGLENLRKRLRERPVYGPLMRPCPMICGPVNEMGVVYLFGAMAEKLGFVVLRIRPEFPDCEALIRVDEDRWELVRIEFEYESRNFLKHAHKPGDCDLIVCWKHNWPECPVDVVELRRELKKVFGEGNDPFAADLR
jgi:hypothetical protein